MNKNKHKIDYLLAILVGLLVLTGLAMLWSASTLEAEKTFGDTNYLLVKQLTRGVLVGLVAMFVFYKLDYRKLKKPSWILAIIALILLVLVKIPGLGITANGATRWIELGPILFQPSEFAKLALIIYLAAWGSNHTRNINSFWQSVFPPLLTIGVMAGLVIWQPDLGTTIALVSVAMIMLFTSGARLKYLGWVSGIGVALMTALVYFEPYRMRRITAFLNPDHDPLGVSYQINQALIAIGSGGLLGYGYGQSRQKHFYLPESINDSIFAVVAEELGFVRIVLIILLFLALILRMIYVSVKAPDSFGKLLGFGISSLIAMSVIINIAAITGLLPLTGIPLPFFSYGSSAMIVNLAAIGIMLNIAKQSKSTVQSA